MVRKKKIRQQSKPAAPVKKTELLIDEDPAKSSPAPRHHLDGLTGDVADERPELRRSPEALCLQTRPSMEEEPRSMSSSAPSLPRPAERSCSPLKIQIARRPPALFKEIAVLPLLLGSDHRSCRR
jgi:hypothetical protein